MQKVLLIHGNGGSTASDHWFPYLNRELTKRGVEVIAKDFPDSMLARESYWIPFLKSLGADAETVIVGHSSGAVCAMRYAEKYPLLGSVLVGACYTDLGLESEKLSGYYDAPWGWEAIKHNQKWIAQFASTDDPCIPIEEARHVHKMLNTEYYESTDKGHFTGYGPTSQFPECLKVLTTHLNV